MSQNRALRVVLYPSLLTGLLTVLRWPCDRLKGDSSSRYSPRLCRARRQASEGSTPAGYICRIESHMESGNEAERRTPNCGSAHPPASLRGRSKESVTTARLACHATMSNGTNELRAHQACAPRRGSAVPQEKAKGARNIFHSEKRQKCTAEPTLLCTFQG